MPADLDTLVDYFAFRDFAHFIQVYLSVVDLIRDDAAIAAGLHSVPHAGETTGAATIWDAVRHLRAERIGHGISCIDDPALVEYLRDREIPLEVCPTSNVRTRAVPSIDEHPLAQMVAAGLVVTINSDDPPMFGTTLNDEYEVAAQLLQLDAPGVAGLAGSAVRASFLPAADKARILAEIDADTAAFASTSSS